jgi:hypothetical protein
MKMTNADVFHLESGKEVGVEFITNEITFTDNPNQIRFFTYNQKNCIPFSVDGLYKTTSLKKERFRYGLYIPTGLSQINVSTTLKSIFELNIKEIRLTNKTKIINRNSSEKNESKTVSTNKISKQNNTHRVFKKASRSRIRKRTSPPKKYNFEKVFRINKKVSTAKNIYRPD